MAPSASSCPDQHQKTQKHHCTNSNNSDGNSNLSLPLMPCSAFQRTPPIQATSVQQSCSANLRKLSQSNQIPELKYGARFTVLFAEKKASSEYLMKQPASIARPSLDGKHPFTFL